MATPHEPRPTGTKDMMLSAAARLCALAVLPWLTVPQNHDAMVESRGSSCNADYPSTNSRSVSVERASWLMGTEMRAVACAESRESGVAALEVAFAAIREVENRLSTWIEASELSRLNAAPPGRWVELSGPTARLLVEMRAWSARTHGAFDPAVGVLLNAWDVRGAGRVPADAELARALDATGIRFVEIDPDNPRARRLRGVLLDAGAFGKGAGLRAAEAALLNVAGLHSAVLDFGGQIEIVTRSGSAQRWTIEVADAAQRQAPLERIRIGPVSVATTGASERFLEVDGRRFGHVIDPRSGRPVPAWGSVTVVAADPVTADVLSTALFVMGPETAIEWSGKTDVGVLLQIRAGGVHTTFRNQALGTWETAEQPASGGE